MKLPAFEDLSKEQDLIYNLDLDGNYLVSGPPGTGKSVMALYRAQVLTIDDREPAVLMYSKVLCQYNEQAADEIDVGMYVRTFHSWFWRWWRSHYGNLPPTLPGKSFDVNWPEVTQVFLNKPSALGSLADLIVDEGQDLSLDFFRITRFIGKNVTVFADENQQLHDHNTTLNEIEKSIGASQHLVLRRNYRNTAEIAAVAAKYYAGAPTGIPDPPERHGDMPTVRRHKDLNSFVDFVEKYAKGRTNLTIGIACPTAKVRDQLYNRLFARKLPMLVQMHPPKERGATKKTRSSKAEKGLDFDSAAITLLHYQSLKGLEFDTLFVPELQKVTMDPTSASTRMTFYVVMSRARDELHLSWSESGRKPQILDGLEGLVQEQ